MRILRLRFKNLNSLAGEWDIDFTHPDYVSNGIFAITGPTGAGKTTILDAVCLALYGQTPRLKRISQSENETMSRHTGDCFAEVEFETRKGRFRCHWSQRRSRKMAGGQLQAPRHEIAEATDGADGTVLESRLKAVAARVEEVTGMDFDRFTRSMLLAQGGFAAFLQARPDERAPILEQITGTGIYSRISMKVHERTAEERKKLALLQTGLDTIACLSPEEEGVLRAEILTREQEVAPLSARVAELGVAQAWRERILALETETARLDEEWLAFEARKEAAASNLNRLAGAGRALSLEADYVQLRALRDQQQEEKGRLQRDGGQLPERELQSRSAAAVLEKASTALEAVRGEQEREAELIRRARELDIKLEEAAGQIKTLRAQTGRQQEQDDEYRRAMRGCELRGRELEEKLREIAASLAASRLDGELVAMLTGIEQRFHTLRGLDQQSRDQRQKLARQQEAVAAAQLTSGQALTDFETAQHAAFQAEEQWRATVAARAALLQGRDLAAWRDEAEKFVARRNQLQSLSEGLSRIAEAETRLAGLQSVWKEQMKKRQLSGLDEKNLAVALGLLEDNCRLLEEKVVLLNRVRDLEAERTRLVDGTPCPLCGAIQHPYAQGNIPRLEEGQRELAEARAEARGLRHNLEKVRAGILGLDKDLEQGERARAELAQRLEGDRDFCREISAGLGLSVAVDSLPERVQTESDQCGKDLAGLRVVIAEAERQQEEERRAQAALSALRDELARLDKLRLAADLECKTAVRDLERLREEAASVGRQLAMTEAEVKKLVAPYGLTDASADRAGQVLDALRVRRDGHVRRLQEQERLGRDLDECRGEREKQQALLTEVQRSLAANLARLREAGEARDTLAARRRLLYGTKDPDGEEKRLALALRDAGTGREAAMREHHRLQAELSGARQQIQSLSASIASREAQLLEREPAFARRLTESGFADEAAFLQARLPSAEVEALRQREESLRREEMEIMTRLRDRREVLLLERGKNLSVQPLESIREEHSEAAARLTGLQQGLGALQQRLSHHREQQQRFQARLQELGRQQEECGRWERLHLLIGSSDGKKFRNFAQGLTFELMVAHANRQLRKMSDRYILVRDEKEPLELNVIDNYQAAEIRSTKNLSGGESFLVSLALSLGLSGMASRSVRVDSLFLDEGFGTLDEDALETALETLAGLQRDGKLIGIISHVPALKERIGTQIQVETGSGGRSVLRGPGCRRVS